MTEWQSINPTREGLSRKINNKKYANDDIVSFNTQFATQWDGFRHFPYQNYPKQGEYTFYGGMSGDEAADPNNKRFGTQNFCQHPITGRGVLLDVVKYRQDNGLPELSLFTTTTPVGLDELKAVAKAQGVEFASGDILLIRIGFGEKILSMSEEERNGLASNKNGWCGIDATEEMIRWHWENQFSAVATDGYAYEAYPSKYPLIAHEVFLGGWGLPIGELFDLRQLAKECAEKKQYDFFVSTDLFQEGLLLTAQFASMPLNIDGGIASPPNAQAVL